MIVSFPTKNNESIFTLYLYSSAIKALVRPKDADPSSIPINFLVFKILLIAGRIFNGEIRVGHTISTKISFFLARQECLLLF